MEPDGASRCAADEAGRGGAPAEAPGRGRCLLGNWQEERATEQLDRVPAGALEGGFHRYGHRALLTPRPEARLDDRSTTRDSYRPPRRTGLPTTGQRQAALEWLLTQKYRKEALEQEAQSPTSSTPLSTTHRDYCWEGPMSAPPAPTKPHDYRLEQPQTFWREHAQQVPGVSRVQTDNAPFKKSSTFTTPVPEQLDLPWPYSPEHLAK